MPRRPRSRPAARPAAPPAAPRAPRRRRGATRLATLTTSLVVVVAATACDTGDGKQLAAPVDPPPPTTTTTSTTLPPVDDTPPPALGAFTLSTSWPSGGPIDVRHTCDGDDLSPSLAWSGVPDGTVELALVVTDLDADRFVHWMVLGIDPSVTGAPEGAPPPTGRELANGFGGLGWAGPCPPAGETHSYLFELRALDQPAEVGDAAADDVLGLLGEVTIGAASSIARYGR